MRATPRIGLLSAVHIPPDGDVKPVKSSTNVRDDPTKGLSVTRRWQAATIAAVMAVGVTACGSGSAPRHAASERSDSATGTTPAAPDTTAPTSATPPPPPTPLDGPVATLDVGSVRLPAGWTVKNGGSDWLLAMCPPRDLGAGCARFSDIHDDSAPTPTPAALDYQVSVEMKLSGGMHWKRKPDVTVGGLLFYRLVDDTDKNAGHEQWGSLHDGRDVVFNFDFSKILMTAKQRRTSIDAIAGSYRPS